MIGCSGERNRTEFVARTDFNNIHLLNDYRLLEDANRLADNAKRDYRIKSGSRPTKKGNILQKAASKNDTKVYRMAKGMKRWKENRSQFNIKEKTIYWTVKFVFVDIEEEIISRHSENEFMEDLLSIYINKDKVTAENKLKFTRYINRDVTVLFKQELDPGESNLRYTAADIHKTLKEILTQKTILEYPVFHIALPRTAQRLKQQPYMREPHVKRNYETSSSSDSESDSSDDDGQTNNKIRKLVDL